MFIFIFGTIFFEILIVYFYVFKRLYKINYFSYIYINFILLKKYLITILFL